MAVVKLDTKGLNCPQPVLKIAAKTPEMAAGDVLEVEATCASFEKDVKKWSERMKKVLLWCRKEGDTYTCQIQF